MMNRRRFIESAVAVSLLPLSAKAVNAVHSVVTPKDDWIVIAHTGRTSNGTVYTEDNLADMHCGIVGKHVYSDNGVDGLESLRGLVMESRREKESLAVKVRWFKEQPKGRFYLTPTGFAEQTIVRTVEEKFAALKAENPLFHGGARFPPPFVDFRGLKFPCAFSAGPFVKEDKAYEWKHFLGQRPDADSCAETLRGLGMEPTIEESPGTFMQVKWIWPDSVLFKNYKLEHLALSPSSSFAGATEFEL